MKILTTIFLFILSNTISFSQDDEFITDIAYLPEIIVNTTNTQSVLDLYSVNILDYRVYGDDILILKKEKGEYYLGIENYFGKTESFLLDLKKPKSIFIDCFQKVHILTKDKAYQVLISDKVNIITAVSVVDFNKTIRECKGVFDQTLIMDKLSNYQQEYELLMIDRSTLTSKTIYFEVDNVAIKSMKDYYNSEEKPYNIRPVKMRQGYDYAQGYPDNKALLNNSSYVTDLNSRISRSRTIGNAVMRTENNEFKSRKTRLRNEVDYYYPELNVYNQFTDEKLFSKHIKINTFKFGDSIVIIDQLNNQVVLLSEKGELISKSSFVFDDKIEDVKQDPYNDEIYFTSYNGKQYNVYKLNISNGNMLHAGGFKNIALTRTRKIFDGWIYYRVMKNDYYKLYRTRLRA